VPFRASERSRCLKTAVIGGIPDGLVVYTRSLIDLARHFGFHPKACGPYRAHWGVSTL
jgi:hypothetical protein